MKCIRTVLTEFQQELFDQVTWPRQRLGQGPLERNSGWVVHFHIYIRLAHDIVLTAANRYWSLLTIHWGIVKYRIVHRVSWSSMEAVFDDARVNKGAMPELWLKPWENYIPRTQLYTLEYTNCTQFSILQCHRSQKVFHLCEWSEGISSVSYNFPYFYCETEYFSLSCYHNFERKIKALISKI